MFTRNEKGRLVFDRLNFSLMIGEFIEEARPKDIHELEWIIGKMIDEMQLCASDYSEECDAIEPEWEDICTPFY